MVPILVPCQSQGFGRMAFNGLRLTLQVKGEIALFVGAGLSALGLNSEERKTHRGQHDKKKKKFAASFLQADAEPALAANAAPTKSIRRRRYFSTNARSYT